VTGTFFPPEAKRHIMKRYPASGPLTGFLAIVLLSIVLVIPAGASFVFQDVSVIPGPPLSTGQAVSSTSELVIIPQGGSTTFIGNNQLQLTTQLDGARWHVIVVVNGQPAAQLPVNGNTVFINGFLLSYPVSSDVAVSVNVNGTVPAGAGPYLNIVQAVQLNNAGQTVPGSLQVVSEPMAVPATSVPQTNPVTSSPARTAAAPTKAPGFSQETGAGALIMCCLVAWGWGHIRKT